MVMDTCILNTWEGGCYRKVMSFWQVCYIVRYYLNNNNNKKEANKNQYIYCTYTQISFVLSTFMVWVIEWDLKVVFPTVNPDRGCRMFFFLES